MTDPKFDPMRELNNLRNSVTRMIEQGIQTVQTATTPTSGVKLDVYEIDAELVIRTSPLDNLIPSSIEVSMEGNVLTISGETQPDDTPLNASFLVQERKFGHFSRSVAITIPVKADEARAKLKNGSLTITLPIDRDNYRSIDVTADDF